MKEVEKVQEEMKEIEKVEEKKKPKAKKVKLVIL